jgi:hypothetical protein
MSKPAISFFSQLRQPWVRSSSKTPRSPGGAKEQVPLHEPPHPRGFHPCIESCLLSPLTGLGRGGGADFPTACEAVKRFIFAKDRGVANGLWGWSRAGQQAIGSFSIFDCRFSICDVQLSISNWRFEICDSVPRIVPYLPLITHHGFCHRANENPPTRQIGSSSHPAPPIAEAGKCHAGV